MVNGFYKKLRQDMFLASSVTMIISYNESYECNCSPTIYSDQCGTCSSTLPAGSVLSNGIYFTKIAP